MRSSASGVSASRVLLVAVAKSMCPGDLRIPRSILPRGTWSLTRLAEGQGGGHLHTSVLFI